MSAIKMTPVYPGSMKPARVGVYRRLYPRRDEGSIVYSVFDGTFWHYGTNTIESALRNPYRSPRQDLPWQGITAPTRKEKGR